MINPQKNTWIEQIPILSGSRFFQPHFLPFIRRKPAFSGFRIAGVPPEKNPVHLMFGCLHADEPGKVLK
jgi:hypothetical protein